MARMEEPRTYLVNNVKTASGLNLAAGVWLVLAPFLLGYTNLERPLWNDLACGIVVILLSAMRLNMPLRHEWMSWVNCAIGIWLIVAPFALEYSQFATPVWNDVVLGVLIAALAAWSALSTMSARDRTLE